MSKSKRISCCVVGNTKVAVDCAKILLDSGFELKTVFTEDSQFKEWSLSYQVPVYSISYFRTCMKRKDKKEFFNRFDFLFSIVNDVIIPSEVLASIKLLSINYHNGPLPRYAGCNAVNWAMINGEKNHGVSWHVIEEMVDTGRVLAQLKFYIDEKDMLLDVNSKCNDMAVSSFKLVCEQLCSLHEGNNFAQLSQENKLILYNGINQKPTPFCLLPLESTAREILNFYRGTFHQYGINELGVPKLLLPGDNLVVVSKMSIYDDLLKTDYQSGTVISVSSDNIVISAADRSCISIDELTKLDGTVFPKPFSNTLCHLEGSNLSLSVELQQQLSHYCENMGMNARKWGRKLLLQQNRGNELSLEWPYYCYGTRSGAENVLEVITVCDINVSDIYPKALLQSPELSTLSSFLIFLICLSPSNLVYTDVFFGNVPREHSSFFIPFIPFLLKISPENSFEKNLEDMNSKLANVMYVERKNLPPCDLFLCYPISKRKNSIAICGNSFPLQLSNHKLVVQCLRVEDKVSLQLHHQAAEFNSRSFCSVKADFSAFLNAVSLNPSKKLKTYPLCDVSALKMSNTLKGPCGYNFPSSLHHPFNEAVKKYPHAIAIMDKDGQYTYSELDNKIDEIAHLIGMKCSAAVKRVGLILDRTWLSIAAMLAVLRLGATVIPIEKSWPEQRIAQIVNDCRPEIAIFESVSLLSGLSQLSLFPRTAFLDELYFRDCHGVHYDLNSETAYLLYTSGTTGKPKGVVLHHAGLCNLLQYFMLETEYASKTSLAVDGEYSAHSTPCTFDTIFLEIFPALWSNGTVLTLPVNPLKASRLTGFLRYVTSLVTQPVKLAFFDPTMFQSANKVTFGGEAPTMELLRPWLQPAPKYQVPNRRLWNAYGPTEGSIITTMGQITDCIHLGKCTGNAELKILNCNKQALPVGVAGELHIAGTGVATGYTDPALTEAVFWECDGVACYKTGDFIYLDDQEVLHFLGRIPKDKQVKIGGVRIELFEIEHALRSLHGVQFAHVTLMKRRNDRLMAYVCPQSLDVNDIKASLAEILPPYMIPSTITLISRDNITFNNSGKLVMLEEANSQLSRMLSDQDGKMASILIKCLGSNVVNDPSLSSKSLSSCGVDSISVLYLTNQIKSIFGCSLRPSDVVDKTVSQLLSQFSSAEEVSDNHQPVSKEESLKLISSAAAYNSISALNQLLAGPTYNVPIVYHIRGQINCMLLSHALETALSRIRDAYRRENRQAAVSEHTVVHVDLSSYSPEQRYSVAIDCCQRDALQIIDFKSSHPYLCKLFYLGSERHILSVVIHHIAFDYSSLRLVEEIVEDEYTEKESESSIVEDFDNYLKFLTRQAGMRDNDYQYWCRYLKNCDLFVDTPVTYSRNNTCPFIGQRLTYALTEDISKRIEETCALMNTDPVTFFLSLFSLVIYNLSCRAGFGIGISFSLRAEPELKKVIGYLTNTVLFCFSPEMLLRPFSIMLQHLQSWIEESIVHATFPLQEATKLCKKRPNSDISPRYTPQYLFNFLSCRRKGLSLGRDVTTELISIETRTSKAEIMLDVQSNGQTFEYTWEYSTSLYSLEAMQHMNSLFEKLIVHLLSDINSVSYSWNLMLTSTTLSYQSDAETGLTLDQEDILLPISNFHSVFIDKITQLPLQECKTFHSTASAIISCSRDHQYIMGVVASKLSSSDYLHSHVHSKNNTWFLKVSRESKFTINFESVVSEGDLEAVKMRDSLWPFDLFRAPLFRITVIEHMHTSPGYMEVFVVAHQVLLNEASVMRLAMSLANAFSESPMDMYDLLYNCSSEDSTVKPTDMAGVEWIKDLSSQRRLPYLSITSESYITTSLTLPVQTVEQSAGPEVFWCSLVSAFLYKVTKAHDIQLAFLKSDSSSYLTFYEEITPMSVSTDPESTIAVLQLQIHKQLLLLQEKKLIPYYWEMQEHVDPFLSLSRPYHEVLLHIIFGDGCKSIKTACFRPFNIVCTLDLSKSEITLRTRLPPLQTVTLQKCFQSILSIFTNSQITQLSLIELSFEIEKTSSISVSKLDSLLNSNCEYRLASMLYKVCDSVPNRIAFCRIANGRDCYLTVQEAFLLISSVKHKIQTRLAKCSEKIEHIAILMTNSFELPLSLIAIMLCQHAFLVLDPTDNVDNLKNKLSVSSTKCILYDYESLDVMEKITQSNPKIISIFIEAYSPELDEDVCYYPQQTVTKKDESAFIVFTSGTTGEPKLVSVTEKSLVNFLLWDVWACLRQKHCIQIMHNQFDVFVAEILGQFLSESTLYLINSAHRLDRQYLWKIIRHYAINTMYSTPTILSLLLGQHLSGGGDSGITQCWNSHSLASLRHVLSVGEKISKDLCALFFRRFPPGRNPVYLHNWGGPCECCIGYSHCIVNELNSADFIPMGHLIPNSSLMIANENSYGVLPIGLPGEVLVSGACSQNQKVKRNCLLIHNKPWFATGDIGFLNNHQQLVLLHRKDSQVKIASQRVELLGIRSSILHLELPGLVDVIVDAFAHKDGLELVCFLIVSDQVYKMQNYQEQLLLRLNILHMPRVVDVYCSDEVPLLLSGKINIKHLRELAFSAKKTCTILEKLQVHLKVQYLS